MRTTIIKNKNSNIFSFLSESMRKNEYQRTNFFQNIFIINLIHNINIITLKNQYNVIIFSYKFTWTHQMKMCFKSLKIAGRLKKKKLKRQRLTKHSPFPSLLRQEGWFEDKVLKNKKLKKRKRKRDHRWWKRNKKL